MENKAGIHDMSYKDGKNLAYKAALYNENIPFDDLHKYFNKKNVLYKYRTFYTDKGENPFWKESVKGVFHLSRAIEFEDEKDCEPIFNKLDIVDYIVDFAKQCGYPMDAGEICMLKRAADEEFNDEYFKDIKNNYQNDILIGCLTDSSNYYNMWEKYGGNQKGFCIEYDVKSNELLNSKTFPVVYEHSPYDASKSLAINVIVGGKKQ